MSTQRCLLVPLLGCLLLGCNRTPPAPPPAVVKKPVEEAVDKGAGELGKQEAVNKGVGELGKQLAVTDKDLERKAVSFLIDGVRDNEHQSELFSKVSRLKDAGITISSLSRGAYHQKDIYFRISPISDIEAAAAKIDFGLVLAVDPADRVVVVDASAKPAPRPETGWPGAKAVDQYVVRKAKTWAAGWAYASVVKKFGPEKVVVVAIRSKDQAADPVVKKLRKLVPDLRRTDGPDFGVRNTPFAIVTMAPNEKLADVVKALDGEPILTVDEERRVVIVADLAELKPPRAEAKDPAPAK